MWGLRSSLLLPGFSSSTWWCFQVWDTQAQSGLWWPGDVRGNYWFCLWVELSVSSARCLPYTNDHWDRALIGQLYPATDWLLDENLLLFTSSWWSSGHLSLSPVCKIETFLTLIVLQIVQLTSVTPGGRKQPVRGWGEGYRLTTDWADLQGDGGTCQTDHYRHLHYQISFFSLIP